MSLSDLASRKRVELRDIDKDMRGINPKTEMYKRLSKKREKVIKELEQIGAERTAQKTV